MTEVLWSSKEAQEATGGIVKGSWVANGVSIDSRTIRPKDLFVAIAGEKYNGKDFLQSSLDCGASAVMISDIDETNHPRLIVKDTLKGLEDLGRFARQRTSAKIIAVTGSVGKTGTKDALKLLLSESGKTHSSEGSYNNHVGVPLSLARLPSDSDFAIFEIGMSQAGEIEPLSRLIHPNVVIITTVEPAHLESFNSVDEIALAKSEIFQGLVPEGIAILNADNKYFELLSGEAKKIGIQVIKFGENEDADVKLTKYVLHDDCSTVFAEIFGKKIAYKISVPGRHWVQNSLAVLSAVHVVGGDLGRALLAFNKMNLSPGRGKSYSLETPDGSFKLIDDSFNANPASVSAAIQNLSKISIGKKGKRIAVLGDMLELGPSSEKFHAEIARQVEIENIDLVFTVGSISKSLQKLLPKINQGGHLASVDEAFIALKKHIMPGDLVLIKGSKSIGMSSIVRRFVEKFEQGFE